MQFAIEDTFSEAIAQSLLTGRFNPAILATALIGATGIAREFAAAAYFGERFKDIVRGSSPILAGLIGGVLFINIVQNIRPALQGTILQGSLVEKAVDSFVEGQAALARRLREIRIGIGQRIQQVVQ
jgi:hypothetical protein